MKILRYTQSAILLCSILMLAACGGDDDDGGSAGNNSTPVSPSDPNALSQVLIIPNSTTTTGTPPQSSTDNAAPDIVGNAESITSSNGSTANIPFDYSNVATNLGGCYIQVEGADTYFQVPYGANSGSSGELTIPITIPTNVTAGNFSLYYCVYDENGLVSNPLYSTVEVLSLGTGDLQISLSWNTNYTDIDLYVEEPSGEVLSYQNTFSETGGELDRDDTDGYGPENIYWTDGGAPDGTYTVSVDYYSGSASTSYTVTINGANTSRTFNGTLSSSGDSDQVVTFTKSGGNISF